MKSEVAVSINDVLESNKIKIKSNIRCCWCTYIIAYCYGIIVLFIIVVLIFSL